MFDKPKLTREQARAIENFKRSHKNSLKGNVSKLVLVYQEHSSSWNSEYRPLRELGLDNFIVALVAGYDTVEKVGDFIKGFKWDKEISDYREGWNDAINKIMRSLPKNIEDMEIKLP